MATPKEAREVVDELNSNYCFADEDMMNKLRNLDPKGYLKMKKRQAAQRTLAARAVKTLAKEIYGDGVRFIFELLQNADDNKFAKAAKRNEPPFIRFQIWPQKIVVECNEDGFTKADLSALCDIGQSTKTTRYGYIGAKGIGFKSVFIAASRVHVHSGNFSFQFCYRDGDDGLGMVRPIWTDPTETIFDPMTRMTLWLHADGNAKQTAGYNAMVMKQLEDLDAACLIFLKKLQKISIEYCSKEGYTKKVTHFSKKNLGANRVALVAVTQEGGRTSQRDRIYHITRQEATDLPYSSNREIMSSSENRDLQRTADVILAFPLSKERKPITDEPQHLVAFLPIRRMNYKFLIHSDFDTNVSREDILVDSERNRSLLDWIARAFTRAALQFSEDKIMARE
ncbi:hypothetical protein PWT90_00728 [Aphanocladium album]|nr:hypothetical protein PWT90_00728 [Aphanocladium album]